MHMHCQHTPTRARVAVRARVAYSARACAWMHMHAPCVDLLDAYGVQVTYSVVVTPPSRASYIVHTCLRVLAGATGRTCNRVGHGELVMSGEL